MFEELISLLKQLESQTVGNGCLCFRQPQTSVLNAVWRFIFISFEQFAFN